MPWSKLNKYWIIFNYIYYTNSNELPSIEMSYQTTDSKKEEFRKYLEKGGVIDEMTKVLVSLYEEPEKPSNAVE